MLFRSAELLNVVGCTLMNSHHDTQAEYPDSRISFFLLKNYKLLQNMELVLCVIHAFTILNHRNLHPQICQIIFSQFQSRKVLSSFPLRLFALSAITLFPNAFQPTPLKETGLCLKLMRKRIYTINPMQDSLIYKFSAY